MPKPMQFGRRTLKHLYNDLREVFSLYDLEIFQDDGAWFMRDDYSDTYKIHLVPFKQHKPWQDTRGAKKGSKTEFGPINPAAKEKAPELSQEPVGMRDYSGTLAPV